MSKIKYYAYSLDNGKNNGITLSWAECEKIIKGQNAKYKSFATEGLAREWLSSGANYSYKPAAPEVKLKPGIYFDAGTGRGIGVEVKVTDEKGINLLSTILPKDHINQFGNYLAPKGSTNNFGELFGCLVALKLALKTGTKEIFGDSKLVIDYWSKGIAKINELPANTVKLISEVKQARREFEIAGGRITHVSGDINPADLGFHK